MTKVQEYFATGESGYVEISGGVVSVIGGLGSTKEIGEIGYVEVSIEHPEQMLGISRAEHIMLFNESNEELHDDQNMIDNTEYNSDKELIEEIAKRYGISQDIIEIIE